MLVPWTSGAPEGAAVATVCVGVPGSGAARGAAETYESAPIGVIERWARDAELRGADVRARMLRGVWRDGAPSDAPFLDRLGVQAVRLCASDLGVTPRELAVLTDVSPRDVRGAVQRRFGAPTPAAQAGVMASAGIGGGSWPAAQPREA